MRTRQRSGTSFQMILPSVISSQATPGGAPRFGRVTQPGLRNRTRPRLSLRGTCVCPCRRTSISSGGSSGATCCNRNFKPSRARSRTNGHSKLLSQFPRTTITAGPIACSSSRIVSAQTSPRCQISSASLAISLMRSGRRLCVSASTNTRRAFSDFAFTATLLLSFQLARPAKNIDGLMTKHMPYA
jgi:hypothetical protein